MRFHPSLRPAFLGLALVNNILTSVSLPHLQWLDIARTEFVGFSLSEIRFGIWSNCQYDTFHEESCSPPVFGYTTELSTFNQTVTIGATLTRALIIHVFAAVASFIAFMLAPAVIPKTAIFASVFAASITLAAVAVDLALHMLVEKQMANLEADDAQTFLGGGFWSTAAAFWFLVAGTIVVLHQYKLQKRSIESYPMDPASPGS